ncbi:hypothetical protein ALC60_04820, partial [Trachymyrmex zeteki]
VSAICIPFISQAIIRRHPVHDLARLEETLLARPNKCKWWKRPREGRKEPQLNEFAFAVTVPHKSRGLDKDRFNYPFNYRKAICNRREARKLGEDFHKAFPQRPER